MVKDIPIEDLYSQPVVQELLEKIGKGKIDLDTIKIPYIIKDKILMSPGVWNNFYYSPEAIKEAFLESKWNEKEIRSLFLDHIDNSSREWIGEILNPRMKGEDLIGDLVFIDKPTAQKLAYGAKMGISPKVHGEEENNEMMHFAFDNFSVVINPAVKTAYINMAEDKSPYGDVEYADPGFQNDKQKRYPIDTEAHTKAAWSYINMPKNRKFYTKEQLEKIEKRIKTAAKKFGIKITNQEVKVKMADEEEKKPEEQKVEETPKVEEPKAEESQEEEKEMSEVDKFVDALNEIETENQGGVGAIAKKAKQIRKEGESWAEAFKRAAKMMAGGEEKPEEKPVEKPEEKKEEPKENSSKIFSDAVDQIIKLGDILKGNKKLQEDEEEKPEEEKKPEEEEKTEEKPEEKKEESVENKDSENEIKKMSSTIKELNDQLQKVETKLNEPDKKTAKTEELSAADAETLIQANPDEAFLSMLKRL